MLIAKYASELYDFLVMMPREIISIITEYLLIVPHIPRFLRFDDGKIDSMCMVKEFILAAKHGRRIEIIDIRNGNYLRYIDIPTRRSGRHREKITSPMSGVLYYDGYLWADNDYKPVNQSYYIRGACAVGSKLLYYHKKRIFLDGKKVINDGLPLTKLEQWVYDDKENVHLITTTIGMKIYISTLINNKINILRNIEVYGNMFYAWSSYKIWNLGSIEDILTGHTIANIDSQGHYFDNVVVASSNIYIQHECEISVVSEKGKKITKMDDLSACDFDEYDKLAPRIAGNETYTVLFTKNINFYDQNNQCIYSTSDPQTIAEFPDGIIFTKNNDMIVSYENGEIRIFAEGQI